MQLVPLSTARSTRDRERAGLWLKIAFVVGLDDEQRYLAVESSIFGLCVNRVTQYCPLRVEYERHKSTRQAAHVHIHGESAGLGYAYAPGRLLAPLAAVPAGRVWRSFRHSRKNRGAGASQSGSSGS